MKNLMKFEQSEEITIFIRNTEATLTVVETLAKIKESTLRLTPNFDQQKIDVR